MLRQIENIFTITDFLKTTDPAVKIMMSVHYVLCTITSHSTHTACPCAVYLCTRPFALESCLRLPVSLEASAFDSQTVATDHQGALLTSLVPKCCPVNTAVPPRPPSANSTQDTVISSSPYSLMLHSVEDLNKVNN